MEEYKSRKDAGLPAEIVSMQEVAEQRLITPKVADSDSASKHEQEKLDDVDVVRDAYHHFNTFKGLIVDMIFSFRERNESREYFLSQTAVDALRVIEVELNFMYEAFYTKASVVRDKVGYLFRFVGVCSIVAALVLFVLDQKHGCDKFDIMVTYTLFYGAVALDLVSLLMLIFSDHTYASFAHPQRNYCTRGIGKFAISVFKTYLKLKRPTWQEKPERKGKILSTRTLSRRWSGSISEFNLVSYILNKRGSWVDKVIDYIGATELVEQWRYEKKKPLLQDLWIFIFKELERKSGDADDVETIQRICSSRGAWVIQEGQVLRDDINRLMPYVDANTVSFDQSLILWHIATDLLFYEEKVIQVSNIDHETDEDVQRNFSKLLSDYMLYLLIMQPTMMSAVRGIGQIRFQDTCAEAIKFFEKRDIMAEKEKGNDAFSKNFWNRLIDLGKKKFHKSTRKIEKNIEHQKEACSKLSGVCTELEPSSVKGDRSKSVLFDGCRLAYELKNLKEKKNKWKIMAQVWVELLSYAACSCRPITHVQQLSKGGEFMSLVWLLMTHLGLAKQFQIKEGHARAKLIVGEEDIQTS